jgi:hypothetical protein
MHNAHTPARTDGRTHTRTHTHSHARTHRHALTHARTGTDTHRCKHTTHDIYTSLRLHAYTPTRRPHTGPAIRVLPPSRSARARACSRACDPRSAPRRRRYGAATPHFTRHRAVGNTQRNRLWPTTCGAALPACPARQQAYAPETRRRRGAQTRDVQRVVCRVLQRVATCGAPRRDGGRTDRCIRTVDGRTTGAQGVLSEYSRSAPVRGRVPAWLSSLRRCTQPERGP